MEHAYLRSGVALTWKKRGSGRGLTRMKGSEKERASYGLSAFLTATVEERRNEKWKMENDKWKMLSPLSLSP